MSTINDMWPFIIYCAETTRNGTEVSILSRNKTTLDSNAVQSQKAVTAVTVHSSSDQLLPWPLPSGFAEQLQNNPFLS